MKGTSFALHRRIWCHDAVVVHEVDLLVLWDQACYHTQHVLLVVVVLGGLHESPLLAPRRGLDECLSFVSVQY